MRAALLDRKPMPLPASRHASVVRSFDNDDTIYYKGVRIKPGATAFILPCHNEEADLPEALESIKNQTGATVGTILVVSDNSTDDTVGIAKRAGVSVIETVGNSYKKAGALNAGIRHLMHRDGFLPEYIITGDGDTVYESTFMVRALNVMRRDPQLGVLSAVCYGKTGLLAPPKFVLSVSPRHQNHSFWPVCFFWMMLAFFVGARNLMIQFINYTLLWMQRAEYARAVASRVRQEIHTMSGAGSVLRAQAVVDVLYQAVPPGKFIDWQTAQVYREHAANLVEDFALTLDIKKIGWKCTSNFLVVAHTDLMRDFTSLIRQRVRWVRGTIDELRRRKFSLESRRSAVTVIFGISLIPLMHAINVLFVWLLVTSSFTIMNFWFLPLMGLYQAVMVRKMGWKSMAIAFALLPEMLFAIMRHSWIIISIGKSFTSAQQKWS